MASTMKARQYTPLKDALEKSILLSNVTAPSKSSLLKDQILVKVISAVVNPAHYKLPEFLLARFLVKHPAVLGLDFCERVLEAPIRSSLANSSLELFSRIAQQGMIGEIIAISSSEVTPLRGGGNTDDAAEVGTSSLAAYVALVLEIVKSGVEVFINGGSGGVGTWAIQFAKARGAKVTTTYSTANVEICKSLGANEVIDYKKVDILSELEKRGPIFDLVVDNVGSTGFYEHSHKFLQPNGVFVQLGD